MAHDTQRTAFERQTRREVEKKHFFRLDLVAQREEFGVIYDGYVLLTLRIVLQKLYKLIVLGSNPVRHSPTAV